MLMELSVVPLGRGPSIGADIADLVKLIDATGLDYRLTAAGTIVEGNWDELLSLAKHCHTAMRQKTRRVITSIKIDDYEGRSGRLASMVRSIEEKVGKPVKK